jgi:hypothetical protein
MFDANILKKLSKKEKQAISRLGVQARLLKQMALDPPEYPPIPKGLQLVNLVLDFRFENAVAHHAFLFNTEGKKNRYKWIRNNKRQQGLIGWHDASRDIASNVKPIVTIY